MIKKVLDEIGESFLYAAIGIAINIMLYSIYVIASGF